MEESRNLRNFSISLSDLEKIQEEVARRVREKRVKKVSRICGVDVHFFENVANCCAVILDAKEFEIIEKKVVIEIVKFPYIPGFLGFREGAIMIKAIKSLEEKFDVIIVDGNGKLHPRKCGLATHIGVTLQKPTIGFAKELLCGELRELPKKYGEYREIFLGEEIVGAAVKNTKNAKPVYVSVGNLITLEDAIRIVLECSVNRIPEPIRMAHKLSKEFLPKNLKDLGSV